MFIKIKDKNANVLINSNYVTSFETVEFKDNPGKYYLAIYYSTNPNIEEFYFDNSSFEKITDIMRTIERGIAIGTRIIDLSNF